MKMNIHMNLNLDIILDHKNLVDIKTDITLKFLHQLNLTWPFIDNNYILYIIKNCEYELK